VCLFPGDDNVWVAVDRAASVGARRRGKPDRPLSLCIFFKVEPLLDNDRPNARAVTYEDDGDDYAVLPDTEATHVRKGVLHRKGAAISRFTRGAVDKVHKSSPFKLRIRVEGGQPLLHLWVGVLPRVRAELK